jgi:formylglycine-generating enzyme required for sulfatase activity
MRSLKIRLSKTLTQAFALLGALFCPVAPWAGAGEVTAKLRLQRSADLATWEAVDLTADMITPDGMLALGDLPDRLFFRLDVTVFGLEPTLGRVLGLADSSLSSGGDAEWTVDEGGVGSGAIANNQESWLEATFEGPGDLFYEWKVSSAADYDFLEVYLDGVLQAGISGEVDWQAQTLFLGVGERVVRWRYVKNSAVKSGLDRAWLREVEFEPLTVPRVTWHPDDERVREPSTASFRVEAVGALAYQWQLSTDAGNTWSDLAGADEESYTTEATSLTMNGYRYRCVITNEYGAATSQVAVLSVDEILVPGQMVLVEGGTLQTDNELNGTLVSTFEIGRYEVTWGQWKEVRAYAVANGYDIGGVGGGCADDHPVHSVNWYDVLKWCNAKSEMEGLIPVYVVSGGVYRTGETIPGQNLMATGYRLPLEAEWEFAVRGGNQSNGYTYAGSNDPNKVGWYEANSGGAACNLSDGRGTWPVGEKAANELGLYDMSGNLWEWCWDESWDTARVLRGGSWVSLACRTEVSNRHNSPAASRWHNQGFRPARSVPEMVLVEGGTLQTDNELNGTLVSTFEIGRYEVTWGQWKEVRSWAAANGYDIGSFGDGCADNHPVHSVSWYDVVKWCNAKSEMEGLIPVYAVSGGVYRTGETIPGQNLMATGYRLPLVAEWEFAARGGNQSNGYTYAGGNDLNEVGWYRDNSGGAECDYWEGRATWPVGEKASNEFGLYDMSGNVWEMCWDVADASDEYPLRVSRGGSWAEDTAWFLSRLSIFPEERWSPEVGFRLARRYYVPEMVLVEGGTLQTDNELNGTVVSTFEIGRYEVTWGQWKEVRSWAAANGYDIGSFGDGCADNHPVHSVNWYDVLKWCNAKSEMEGLIPVYAVSGGVYRTGETIPGQNLMATGYRLPLEAEWEFAVRGGNQSNGYTYAGSNDPNKVGWYRDNSAVAECNYSSGRGTWPVGEKASNELGLYDMSGNVWEWCWNDIDSFRRIRGGSWNSDAYVAAVSYRGIGYPVSRLNSYGFRPARSSGN